MNTLGVIKQFKDLIRQGYGYTQLLQKLELTEETIKDMVREYPEFGLVIKDRYGIIVDAVEEKQPKSLKRKKKDEKPQEESNEGVTNANEAVSEGE